MKASAYGKIGFFVVAAIALAVAAAMLAGGKKGAKVEVLFETYIEETVQGISPGTAVRYRGIPVGNVKSVGFASMRYETPEETPEERRAARYARVVFGIGTDEMPGDEELAAFVERQVADGLRVHVKSQGITGLSYLDLDYEGTEREELPVPWTPEHAYIPTAPSLVKTLTDVVQGLSQEIRGFSQVTGSVTELAEKTGRLADTANEAVLKLDAGFEGLPGLVATASNTLADADALIKALGPTADALPGLVADGRGLVAGAGAELESLSGPLREAVGNLARAADEIAGLAEELKENPTKILHGDQKETLP
jgi:ABC-type transporter Mla subunit MlaD